MLRVTSINKAELAKYLACTAYYAALRFSRNRKAVETSNAVKTVLDRSS